MINIPTFEYSEQIDLKYKSEIKYVKPNKTKRAEMVVIIKIM
jgi:hypothetical protein